jgi:hypothetical protein
VKRRTRRVAVSQSRLVELLDETITVLRIMEDAMWELRDLPGAEPIITKARRRAHEVVDGVHRVEVVRLNWFDEETKR